MVKKTLYIFLLSLTSVAFLVGGEFTASVSTTQVHLNENFLLNLTLKDTSAKKQSPDLSALKKDFSIHSQQQSTNMMSMNGKVSSSITWKLYLTPKSEGVAEIPSVSIDTAEGLLSTKPIALNVVKGSTSQSNVDSVGLKVSTTVSNPSPYKNEPIIYTALLTSKMSLYNVKTQKIHVEDAIVEFVKEPKLEERFIDGVLLNVVEFTYLITPLKTGPLTIPSSAIQGALPQKRKDQYGHFLNDDLDLFSLMEGLDRLKPFSLLTEEIHVDVRPAIAEVSPWLPAKALTVEEQWPSGQPLRVGEPFSRGFLIKAEGLKASQLPHLEGLQHQNSTFKVYADKPEEQENVVQDILHSQRKEQYTFIPQQPGKGVLPEISISWWDSTKKEKRNAVIPARTVEILPALAAANSVSNEIIASNQATIPHIESSPAEAPVLSNPSSFIMYSLIGILTFFLAAALVWGFILQRKIARLTDGHTQKPTKPQTTHPQKSIVPPALTPIKEKKEKLPDLNPT